MLTFLEKGYRINLQQVIHRVTAMDSVPEGRGHDSKRMEAKIR